MEIFKLLDRFELLFENDDRFADIRRAYIDQDLSSIFKLSNTADDLRKAVLEQNWHSIFRVIDNRRCLGDIEDFRKVVLEENLHSLFRLLPGTDDLRKAVLNHDLHSIFRLIDYKDLKGLVLNDNYYDLWRVLNNYTNTHFIYAFKTLIESEIKFDEDCFSQGQLKSKKWLVEELKACSVDLGTVFLCAGWYGTLATMLFESKIPLNKIRSFDLDPSCVEIAEIFNKKWVVDNWKFKASCQDIHNFIFNDDHIYRVYKAGGEEELLYDTPDTLINTSSEHIKDYCAWFNRIPDGKLVVVQGNDYIEIDEHINCSKDLKEFSDKSPMTTVLYEGELELEKYKRFMKIGYK